VAHGRESPARKFKIDKRMAELAGSVLGDGNIYTKNHKYVLMITGDRNKDSKYLEYLAGLIFDILGKRPSVRPCIGGIRLRLNSKDLVTFLLEELGMHEGAGKCYVAQVPKSLLAWEKFKYVVRGLADTDGSIFTSDKPGSLSYPSIEITTTSQKLAFQVYEKLSVRRFRARIRNCVDRRYGTDTFKISLNGWNMLEKWNSEVGFSNPVKLKKAVDIVNNRNLMIRERSSARESNLW
jgi:hypothetical protein